MNIFVVGSEGMLATDLVPILKEKGHRVFTGDRESFDILNEKAVEVILGEIKPDVIINCAAYTNVDGAEENKVLALNINKEGARNLSVAAKNINAKMVYISTDYVFDGEKTSPYFEEEEPNPLNVYGDTKFKGEEAVTANAASYLIIRTSWLYGAGGHNFVKTIEEASKKKEELKVVNDQTGTPTFTKDLSEAIINLIEEDKNGIYNFSNEGETSWYGFAKEIVELLKEKNIELKVKEVLPIPTSEFPLPAKRPSYSVLSKEKYKKDTNKEVPFWKDSLKRYFEENY